MKGVKMLEPRDGEIGIWSALAWQESGRLELGCT